jgi:hypothetical protein
MNSHTTDPMRRAASTALAAALFALTTAGVAALCVALFQGRLPEPQQAHVVNLVFDSRPVIWAARLLLVSAAFVLAAGGAFIVASTVARMRNGDWLRRAGPFEVSEARVAALKDEVHLWRSAAYDFRDDVEYLQEPFGDTDQLNQEVTPDDDYDKL